MYLNKYFNILVEEKPAEPEEDLDMGDLFGWLSKPHIHF